MRLLPGGPQTGIALAPTLVATVVEDGAVLLDLDSKYFYSLNATGWAIVQLFETSGADVHRIVAQCRRWGALDETEIHAFLASLSEARIVESAPDTGAAAEPAFSGPWQTPTLTRHGEPLQSIVNSAFDPSIPLAE